MRNIDQIRNNIIDKILSIRNQDFLKALDQLIESSEKSADKIELSSEQIEMLTMSETDIKYGNIISQEELDEADLKWLKK